MGGYCEVDIVIESRHDEVLTRMMKVSQEPILVKRFSVGKYSDELVVDIAQKDRGYLVWLQEQKEQEVAWGNVDEDWLYTLKKCL